MSAATLFLALAVVLAPQDALPTPEATVQAEIRAVAHATSAAEQEAALGALRRLREERSGALVPQLFLYKLGATSTRDAMIPAALLERLGVSREALVRGVAPFLESGVANVRKEAAGVLAEAEDASVERRPTFAAYRELVEPALRTGKTPPAGLTRHLFATDPGVALLLFARVSTTDVEARRPYLWADHVLADYTWRARHGFGRENLRADAQHELGVLVASDTWWARLAAAEYLTRFPALARPEWRTELAGDAHPLVRAAAAE